MISKLFSAIVFFCSLIDAHSVTAAPEVRNGYRDAAIIIAHQFEVRSDQVFQHVGLLGQSGHFRVLYRKTHSAVGVPKVLLDGFWIEAVKVRLLRKAFPQIDEAYEIAGEVEVGGGFGVMCRISPRIAAASRQIKRP